MIMELFIILEEFGHYYFVKLLPDEGNDDDGLREDKYLMPLQMGAFNLSNSKRTLNKNVLAVDGFKDDGTYDTQL